MVLKPIVLNWHREVFADKARRNEIPKEALDILLAEEAAKLKPAKKEDKKTEE